MPACWHCHTEFDREHALRIAENKFVLQWEEWAGWRFSGRFLIAPGNAGRIVPRRLLGMLWEERQRQMTVRPCPVPIQVVTLPARERFEGLA